MMLPLILSVFLFVGRAVGNDKANQYIEEVLTTAYISEVRSQHLDPAVISGFEIEFEDSTMFGKVNVKAEFEEGTFTGLVNVKRHSDCQAQLNIGPKSVNCTLDFDKLKVNYEGNMKYGKMPRMSIMGKAKLSSTQFFIEIINVTPGQPFLKNYSCTQMGTMKAKITGLGPLNRFIKFLDEGFKQHVQARIFNTMSQRLRYALNRSLEKIKFPE